MYKILVTGSGGIGGVNFVRALKKGAIIEEENITIIGTDFNPYHLEFPDVDFRYKTPRHNDPSFISTIVEISKKHGVNFIHPHPSVEAKVISENKHVFEKRGIRVYLPAPQEIAPDKAYIYNVLKKRNVPVPHTFRLRRLSDIKEAFTEIGSPLWIRVIRGAGGRLSLPVKTAEEAEFWVKLNVLQGRAKVEDFILQEYLPGRDIAFDSLWYKGKLITSYARERLEYPFRHISLSGITGTPSVAKIINRDDVNKIGVMAVKALSKNPHGFYSVDIKENKDGHPVVTEVDGKWHTTAPLWGYGFTKIFGKNLYNLAYIYIKLGLGYEEWGNYLPQYNLFPEDYYMIRQIDCGVIFIKPGEGKWRIV